MNILTKNFIIINENGICDKVLYGKDEIYIELKDTINLELFHSFGVHIEPNEIYKYYKYFRDFLFKVSFDFEIDKITNFKIFNGIKYQQIPNSELKGNINFITEFDFSKPSKWRIGFHEQIKTLKINNLKIEFIEDIKYNNFLKKKKILILGGGLILTKDFDINGIENISSFNDVYVYYLKKYLELKYGFLVISIDKNDKQKIENFFDSLPDFDHCINTSLTGFNGWGEYYNKLRNKIKDKICSIRDANKNPKSYGPCDLFFTSIMIEKNEKSIWIKWAADEEIFKPQKKNDEFIILIDDCHYRYSPLHNHSFEILDKCISFLKQDKNLKVIRFGYYDKVINFEDKYKGKIERYEVIKEKIPLAKKAYYHNIAHIYWCTHSETLGIPNIESAMAGCLLLIPAGFVNEQLTSDLLCYKYKNLEDVTLDKIKEKCNPEKQRELALDCSWEKLVDRIYENLED